MTFAASLAKASGKKPVWLYRFTVGATVFHVTRRPSTLFGGPGHVTAIGQPDATFLASQNWTPMPLEHGKLTQSSETARSEWEVSIPAQSTLGIAIRDHEDISKISVKAWQTFKDDVDEEYVVRFEGRVSVRKPGTIILSLVCETGLSELKYQSNPVVIQRPCRHCHYFTPTDANESGCKLDPDDWKVAATASSNTGTLVICNEALDEDDGHYTYGLLFWSGQEFFILSHLGNQLRLDRAPIGMPGFASIDIAPGCDGSLARCEFFENTDNHGGFPFMTETPWTGWAIV
jgi:hypothetical protein